MGEKKGQRVRRALGLIFEIFVIDWLAGWLADDEISGKLINALSSVEIEEAPSNFPRPDGTGMVPDYR